MVRSATLLVMPSGQPSAAEAVLSRVVQEGEDLRLAERIEQALGTAGYPSLRAVEARVGNQLVILRGRVPSYYLKQLAQTVALEVPGVQHLRNDVEVVGPH